MEHRDILNISAAIISGAFIFLSLSISNLDKPNRESIFHLDRQILIAYVVIVSFSFASIVAIMSQLKKSNTKIYNHMINISIGFMIIGFLILIGISLDVILGIIHLID